MITPGNTPINNDFLSILCGDRALISLIMKYVLQTNKTAYGIEDSHALKNSVRSMVCESYRVLRSIKESPNIKSNIVDNKVNMG